MAQANWPAVAGRSATAIRRSRHRSKDCNVFHGDYTGLAVGPHRSIVNVVWTGLNRLATSPQLDPYTGEPHQGYAQDAMYARR